MKTEADELKVIFASNLIKLRTGMGLTQAELAEKLCYSNKSVSKWERAEAIPDAYVLKQMAELFQVTVDQLLTAEEGWTRGGTDLHRKVQYSQLFIILSAVAGIFTLCFLEFVIVWAVVGKFHWLILYAGIPCSLIVLLILNSLWYKGRHNMYIVGALVLSLFLLAYFLSVRFGWNPWQILLAIIPAEAVVFFAFHIRKRKKPEKQRTPEIVESEVER